MQGYGPAQFSLSVAYYLGDGIPKDEAQSAVWLVIAAGLGEPRSVEAVAQVLQRFPIEAREHIQMLADKCKASNYKDCGK